MTEHLLLVSLGPVQDFIASARRCQDLWFGSWLLSELARVSADAVRAACGKDDALIFPASTDIDESGRQKPAVANKLLAVVPAERMPAQVADAGRQAMSERLVELAQDAFSKVARDHFDEALRARAMEQVVDLMEYVWVAVPLGGRDAQRYSLARKQAERLLAARKAQRTWGPVTWGASVPKSSLDGQRESVLHERLFDAIEKGRLSAEAARRQYFVKPAERLCGVSLLKRVGADTTFSEGVARRRTKPAFHSSSHVASAPVRTRLSAWSATSSFDTYAARLEELATAEGSRERLRVSTRGAHVAKARAPWDDAVPGIETPNGYGAAALDGRVLYEGQLAAILDEINPSFSELHPKRQARERRDIATRLATGLRDALRSVDLGVDDVPTYYAVLQADGDRMGETLDAVGERAGLEGQRRLANALDEFSVQCRDLVHAHAGSLVYAGGDDVLALLPLHTALACAARLHQAFGEKLGDALAQAGVTTVRTPTLSIGLGIGHHLDDMAEVRALARAAEASAKALAGKDALAVELQLRSGGRLRARGRWSEPLPLHRRLIEWARRLMTDEIPGKAAYELEEAMAPLLQRASASEGAKGDSIDLGPMAQSLARRVLSRRRAAHGEAALSEETRALIDRALGGGEGATRVAEKVAALSQELQIASLFAHAFGVAFTAPPEQADARAVAQGAR